MISYKLTPEDEKCCARVAAMSREARFKVLANWVRNYESLQIINPKMEDEYRELCRIEQRTYVREQWLTSSQLEAMAEFMGLARRVQALTGQRI